MKTSFWTSGWALNPMTTVLLRDVRDKGSVTRETDRRRAATTEGTDGATKS